MNARRKELRSDARANRAGILEAAEALFAERGPSAPIDDIARRAGVGPGTLYRHFPSKEALFKAIVLDRLEQLVSEAEQIARDADPGAAFFSFLRRVVEEGAVKRDLVDALAKMGYDLKAQTAREMGRANAAMATLLSRAQEAGAVRPDAKATDVFALVSAVVRAGDVKASDTEQRERLLAILITGLRR